MRTKVTMTLTEYANGFCRHPNKEEPMNNAVITKVVTVVRKRVANGTSTIDSLLSLRKASKTILLAGESQQASRQFESGVT